jgi:hypothetical protein
MLYARLKTTLRLVFYVFLILQCAHVSHSAEKNAFAMPAIGAKPPLKYIGNQYNIVLFMILIDNFRRAVVNHLLLLRATRRSRTIWYARLCCAEFSFFFVSI